MEGNRIRAALPVQLFAIRHSRLAMCGGRLEQTISASQVFCPRVNPAGVLVFTRLRPRSRAYQTT